MEDLQYLRYHFEVFSAVSLFGLTTDEIARVARLDAYLDTRNARLHYQEQVLTPSTLSISTSHEVGTQNQQVAEAAPQDQTIEEGTEESRCPTLTATESAVADQTRDEASEEGPNPIGPSVLDNMEISMVHVLPADFQSSTTQPNFLDGDVVTEEAGHVDFVSVAEVESTTKDDSLKAALAELFPRSSLAKLRHLKPLYVTAHIEGYPVSKVFVDCGATVNIMKAIRRSNDELIPSGITMSSFVGDKSQTKGVLPLTVNIAGRTHMTAFFVVDSKTEYNALLGRDWIHQTSCIPSSLYQVLVFWDGNSVTVHPTDSQPFEANMIQARATPAELEDHRPQVKDPLEEINVGTTDDPRPLFISALFPQQMKDKLRALLTEFKDCFAWSYHEMPGLDRTLVEHELRIKPGCKPFRQPPRRFSTEVQLGIKDELVRLLKAGFIRTARYVEWLANIVPVLKKNGALRICIDFRNLNLATPKDDRNLNPPEINYSAVEKLCLAVFFAASKLRHYMLPSVTQVIAQTDVIRYMLTRPIVKGRIGKWTMALSEFSLQYVSQKAVKGQALADFLAHHPSPYGFGDTDVEIGMVETRDNYWTMYFDGSSTSSSAGVGVVIQSPNHDRWYFSLKLDFDCTNNQAEYETLIIGLGLLHDLRATRALVLGDSELVINQLNGYFRCMSCTLAPYHMVASYLAESFDGITLAHVSRIHNTDADELAQIASGAQLLGGKLGREIPMLRQLYPALVNQQILRRDDVIRTRVMSLPSLLDRQDTIEVCTVGTTPDDWRKPIMQYLDNPNGKHSRKTRVHATNYVTYQNELYRKGEDGLLLLCLSPQEGAQAISEVHEGVCGAHQSGRKMRWLLRRHSYFWPRILKDCIEFARGCVQCQIHGPIQRVPAESLHSVIKPWPFRGWAMEVIGKITPSSGAAKHAWIIVATDYFTKWVEAKSYAELTSKEVCNFVEEHIVTRFGVPETIITDNGTIFTAERFKEFGKWSPNWEGPFVVHKVYGKGAYHLQDRTGSVHKLPINGKFLKKYYPVTWEMRE
ncbi:uncharacterized protein [Malus domestica]|uniref:uncharacterized protein n=1 Tax=Malus domestica TaxID=3750 RepID=UPI003976D55F